MNAVTRGGRSNARASLGIDLTRMDAPAEVSTLNSGLAVLFNSSDIAAVKITCCAKFSS